MNDFRIVLCNETNKNLCNFYNLMHPRLDLRDGEWWIAVVSLIRNFTPTDRYIETICINSNLTNPLLFGEKTQFILRAINAHSFIVSYTRKKLQYIKGNKKIFNSIHIELMDIDGRTIFTDRDKGQTTITLSLVNIPENIV